MRLRLTSDQDITRRRIHPSSLPPTISPVYLPTCQQSYLAKQLLFLGTWVLFLSVPKCAQGLQVAHDTKHCRRIEAKRGIDCIRRGTAGSRSSDKAITPLSSFGSCFPCTGFVLRHTRFVVGRVGSSISRLIQIRRRVYLFPGPHQGPKVATPQNLLLGPGVLGPLLGQTWRK